MFKHLAIAGFTLLFVCSSARTDEKELKSLEGSWQPDSAELGGNKLPDELLKTIKLVIKKGEYTVTVGMNVDKGTVKIDGTKKPKEMDIVGTEGPNKGKTFPAIYEWEGDVLKICYDLSSKERPKTFKSENGTKVMLASYRRVKE